MKISIKGLLAIIAAAIIYGLYGVFFRFIGEYFNPFSQNYLANLVAVIILGTYLLIKRTKFNLNISLKWLIIWVLSGSLVNILVFIAFNNLILGTAYFLNYFGMIMAGLIAGKLFFKESFNKAKIASIILLFAGLLLIFSVKINPQSHIYIFLIISGGCLTGLWNSFSKKLSHKLSGIQMIWIYNFTSFFISLFGSFVFKYKLPILAWHPAWIWLLIYSLMSMLVIWLLIFGFKNLEAQIASLILPTEIVFALLFGFLFFKEILATSTFIGGLLIFIAAILPGLSLLQRHNS